MVVQWEVAVGILLAQRGGAVTPKEADSGRDGRWAAAKSFAGGAAKSMLREFQVRRNDQLL